MKSEKSYEEKKKKFLENNGYTCNCYHSVGSIPITILNNDKVVKISAIPIDELKEFEPIIRADERERERKRIGKEPLAEGGRLERIRIKEIIEKYKQEVSDLSYTAKNALDELLKRIENQGGEKCKK